eukprot:3162511-Heterocapsa_arctica.AAC.1
MEAEVCTRTTKRMRPGEVGMKVPDMEEMTMEVQDEEMILYCRSKVTCGAYGHGRRTDQGGTTESDRYAAGNDKPR